MLGGGEGSGAEGGEPEFPAVTDANASAAVFTEQSFALGCTSSHNLMILNY